VSATLFEIWSRGGAGLTISILCTKLALGYLAGGSQLILAGAIGCAGGLAACLAWSCLRMLRESTPVSPTMVLKLINSL